MNFRLVTATLSALAVLGLSPLGRAEDSFGIAGAHGAYALGASAGSMQAGFRQGLDLSLDLGWTTSHGSTRDGFPGKSEQKFFALSSLVGFSRYPSYLSIEYGMGQDNAFVGDNLAFGPVVRIDPEVGYGAGARFQLDAFFLQIGTRTILIAHPKSEAVLMLTMGLGRF